MEFTREQMLRAAGSTGIDVDSDNPLDQAILRIAVIDYPLVAMLADLTVHACPKFEKDDFLLKFIVQAHIFISEQYCNEKIPLEFITDVDSMSRGRIVCWVFTLVAIATCNGHDFVEGLTDDAAQVVDLAGAMEFCHDFCFEKYVPWKDGNLSMVAN